MLLMDVKGSDVENPLWGGVSASPQAKSNGKYNFTVHQCTFLLFISYNLWRPIVLNHKPSRGTQFTVQHIGKELKFNLNDEETQYQATPQLLFISTAM